MEMERLTLGGCLTALRGLAHGQYGPQDAWFASCLRSYHRTLGQNPDIDNYSPQSTVSRILSGKIGMPRDMYAYYATHDDMLRQDSENIFHNHFSS